MTIRKATLGMEIQQSGSEKSLSIQISVDADSGLVHAVAGTAPTSVTRCKSVRWGMTKNGCVRWRGSVNGYRFDSQTVWGVVSAYTTASSVALT